MELNEYQRLANETDQRPAGVGDDGDAVLVFPLMGLASEVGSLVTQYKKRVRDGDAHALFTDRVAEELGDVMWYVANLSAKLDLDLEEIAALNLKRITERWPTEDASVPAKLLDDDYPTEEQLPRLATVRFEEVEVDGRMKLRLSSEGTKLGDELTDMNYDDDGYRFHDAFHLTYAAMLGWSPVARSFFKTKRGSDPRVREIEDGGARRRNRGGDLCVGLRLRPPTTATSREFRISISNCCAACRVSSRISRSALARSATGKRRSCALMKSGASCETIAAAPSI